MARLVLQFDATDYDISEAGLSHSTLFPPCEEEVFDPKLQSFPSQEVFSA